MAKYHSSAIKNKVLECLLSVKLQIFVLSTVLFYVAKLSENGWLIIVGLTTGLREAVNLQSMRMAERNANCDSPKATEDAPNGQ